MRRLQAEQIVGWTLVAALCGMLLILGSRKSAPPPSQKQPAPQAVSQAAMPVSGGRLEQEQTFGAYTVRVYRDEAENSSTLLIYQEEKLVHRDQNVRFQLGHWEGAEQYDHLIPIGSDITGRGIPNLVVGTYSGGAHCCAGFSVFEIGTVFREVGFLNSMHDFSSHFEKRAGEKGLLFISSDFPFAYWKTSFNQSPVQNVIFRFCKGRYRLADDLMRKPPPTRETLRQMAQKISAPSADWTENPPPVLWEAMLDLIYTGNAQSAWKLLDMTWPKGLAGKKQFLKEFKERLASGQYWDQVKLMNEGKPVCR